MSNSGLPAVAQSVEQPDFNSEDAGSRPDSGSTTGEKDE